MLYNVFHSRSRCRLGQVMYSSEGSGLDSRRECKIINHFEVEDGYLNGLKQSGKWVPVMWKNGQKDYFPADRLSVIPPANLKNF